MENLFSTEVILAVIGVISTIIAGIGAVGKHFLNKRDEEQKQIFNERNKEREEIKQNVTNLQKDVKQLNKHIRNITVISMKCDKPDCPTKNAVAAYISNNFDEG